MYEVPTLPLSLDEAVLVMTALSGRKDFKQTKTAEGGQTLSCSLLPDLSRYTISPVLGIKMQKNGVFSVPEMTRWLSEMADICGPATGFTRFLNACSEDQCGVMLCAGLDFFGAGVQLESSEQDIRKRRFFWKAVKTLAAMCGLTDSLLVSDEDDGVRVRLLGDRLVTFTQELQDAAKAAEVFSKGQRIVSFSAQCCHDGQRDVRCVRSVWISFPNIGEVCEILREGPGMDVWQDWSIDVKGSVFKFFVKPDDYETARRRIEKLVPGPWEVTFYGNAPYRFTDLRAAAEENASMVLHGANIKPKGVGLTAIRAQWENGKVVFTFGMANPGKNAAEVLSGLLKEIAGRDIVDWNEV